jgi:anaerobic magnesium-protoporphyrin IX monomethyl ester cyclase
MKILLTTINSKYIHQNLAIRLLYELNKEYEGLSIQEFSPKDSASEIIGLCCTYDIVAFSCYIWNILQTLEVAQMIKQLNPACKILLGGPEVSYDWEEIITLPAIDFIILDEGEMPFSSLLKEFPLVDKVPGLVWKKNGKVIENNAPEVFNLQQLQNINPYAGVDDAELKNKICYIEASRGCPNCCEFCLAGLNNKLRYLPEETIHKNLLYLMDNGRMIKFLDRTFNTHPAFAISVFQFILHHYKPGNIFQFEIKADILQDDLIAFIRNYVPKGIFRFEIGIQTLNAKSNSEIKRKQNFENIKTFIAQIADKIEIHLDLIVGLPHDYLDDIRYSFEEVFKLFAPELQLGFLKFLKGTPIRKKYQEHDYQFDSLPPYQILESKYLTRTQIEGIVLVEHALDIYWNKKRALHTLKYVALTYSIFDFLYGLGLYRKEKTGLRNDGLIEIYSTLHEYSMQHFPENDILPELIALDYYMHYKVKPGIRFLSEISKGERGLIIDRLKLNHHKYRYVMHIVHFSLLKLLRHGVVESSTNLLIIEYTGVDKPRVLL